MDWIRLFFLEVYYGKRKRIFNDGPDVRDVSSGPANDPPMVSGGQDPATGFPW
jgi:hypothetical protein